MPQIVSTSGSSNQIEQIISKAKEYIIIVTPFLNITTPLMSRLYKADKNGVKITLIYGKDDMSFDQMEKLEKLNSLNLYYLDELHAKCYINETTALLSSMNLYEYSQVNNWELGISLESSDEELRSQLLSEVDLIMNTAELISSNSDTKQDHTSKRFIDGCANYLNTFFNTECFEVIDSSFRNDYGEQIFASGYPRRNMDIVIKNDGSKIDFHLFFTNKELYKVNDYLDENLFSDEYRVYKNRRDDISMYYSIEHRDNWNTYTNSFKFEYIAQGIKRLYAHLDDIIK